MERFHLHCRKDRTAFSVRIGLIDRGNDWTTLRLHDTTDGKNFFVIDAMVVNTSDVDEARYDRVGENSHVFTSDNAIGSAVNESASFDSMIANRDLVKNVGIGTVGRCVVD